MTTDITKYAAATDATFGFSGKFGGSIEVVGGSAKAQMAAMQMLEPLTSMAKSTALSAAAIAAASVATLGQLDPLAVGLGAAAGAFSSITKGRS